MLKAFLDRAEKYDQTDRVACVVATVFKPTAYKQFVRPWERMLRRWSASAFHATDFYSGAKEFKRDTPERKKWFEDDARQIPNLVGENVTRVLAVAFRPDEFVSRASTDWKETFGTDTHAIAAQLCLVMNGWWLKDTKPSESFAYLQEAGDESERKIEEAVKRLRADSEYARVIHVSSFNTAEKGEARGLEASDFVAWHWNKHYMDKLRKGEPLPRKDFAALMNLTERQGKVQSAFITGDKLDIFFDALERARKDKLREKAQAQVAR